MSTSISLESVTESVTSYSARQINLAMLQSRLKAKLEDPRYNIAMENHEFGVAPEAFIKWPILNDTYDIVSTSKDR